MALATRRSYAGAAPACTLSSDISASATSFSITGTTTNWPSTATGPFYMVIDPGLSTEEKVLVGARTSGSLSTVTRGVDGTTAASHVTGATCYPVFTAVDANDANLLASRLTAKGDLISSDGSDPTKVAVGANNTRLVADSAQTSGIKWVADTQNTVVDAKGDLLVGTANDTIARLAVGTNGKVLEAASGETTGLKWGGPVGLEFIAGVSFTSQTTAVIDQCFSSSYSNYRVLFDVSAIGTNNSIVAFQFRDVNNATVSTSNYDYTMLEYYNSSVAATSTLAGTYTRVQFCYITPGYMTAVIDILNPQAALRTQWISQATSQNSTTWTLVDNISGHFRTTAQHYGLVFSSVDGYALTGNLRVYGYRNS